MKLLILCNRFPYPVIDGYTIAVFNMIKGLHEAGIDITVLSFNTKKHYVDTAAIPENVKQMAKMHSVYLDATVTPKDAFLNLLTPGKSYNVSRFENKQFKEKLKNILQEEKFDLVQLEGLYVSMYVDAIRMYSDAKIIMRAHNIEFLIWERMADVEKNRLKEWYLRVLAKRLRRYELTALNDYDAIAAITREDAAFFTGRGASIPVWAIPAGIFIEEYSSENDDMEYPSVFHLGALNWMPNLQGIYWFLENVWHKVLMKNPEVKFYVAGRNIPRELNESNLPNVEIVGEVENAAAFMKKKAIMVVPLQSGSGMRLKVVEGMALGKAIVSTVIGAEGISYTNNKNILVAKNETEFATALDELLTDRKKFDSIGEEARKLVERDYDQRIITTDLVQHYEELIKWY
jgi:polysaccharide biosynthesis protein PslH